MNANRQANNMAVEFETIKMNQMLAVIDILLKQGRITKEEAEEARTDAAKKFALNIYGNPFVPSEGGKKVESLILEDNRKQIKDIFDKLVAHPIIGKEVNTQIKNGWKERRDIVCNVVSNSGSGVFITSIIQCSDDTIIVLDTGNRSNLSKYRLMTTKTTLLNVKEIKNTYILTPLNFDKNSMLILSGDEEKSNKMNQDEINKVTNKLHNHLHELVDATESEDEEKAKAIVNQMIDIKEAGFKRLEEENGIFDEDHCHVEKYPKNNYWIKKAQLIRYVIPGKVYHSELQEELKPYYCYVHGAGHSLICVLSEYFNKKNRDGGLVPTPVKTVLRHGYEIKEGYLVCSIPYDKKIGLIVDKEDEEY